MKAMNQEEVLAKAQKKSKKYKEHSQLQRKASTTEEFQRRLDEGLEEIKGVKAICDDILVWGSGEDDTEATQDNDESFGNVLRDVAK
ncbi:hypothetical protein CHS0354_011062 [Potamilus streckersoni]|uniref:Uncharacterized protein n=1 Tax=Potamilus streckersoni TaxID=2493646 RepID=A0AAE0WEI5_9BIVA|nr:hypothetical protein CHS0354_011062 [Potamilus streckersoni]